jgi:predicted DNA-binding transcriptional regulator AlpA
MTGIKHSAVGWPSAVVIEWDRDNHRANGLDPDLVPDEPYHIKRVPAIKERYGFSTATLYRRIADGSFPKPIPLGRPATPELDGGPDPVQS